MKNAMQLKAIMKKLAKENQISAQLVLQNYMLERFLERVSLSPYRDNYIIKGGFLISSIRPPGVQRNHHHLRLRGRSYMGKLLAGGAGHLCSTYQPQL